MRCVPVASSVCLVFLLIAGYLVLPAFDVLAAVTLGESRGLTLLEDIQEAITKLAEDVTPTVVNVSPIRKFDQSRTPNPSRKRAPAKPGSGSGVVVTEDGYIVTNNHVLGEATEAAVNFSDNTTRIGTLVGRDPDTDLALLKVTTDKKLPSATFGDSQTIKVGQWVLAVGNPFGLDRTVTLGVVSGIGRENMNLSRYENFIQTDASINPGNSGGPLFNLRGEVIGINTAIINFAQGIGFAIPSRMVSRVIDQLRQGGRVVRGWLGVGIQSVTAELAEKFGVKEGVGVLINEVFEADPADLAGIQPGDIITKVGGTVVDSPNKLSRLVANYGPGDVTDIEVVRDGMHLTIAVSLGVRQEKPMITSLPPSDDQKQFGFEVQGITPELAKEHSLTESQGVIISNIKRGSIAHTEGLRKGDVVKEVNRIAVETVIEFGKEMKEKKAGDTILLRVLRGERAFYVVLKPQG
ncbi:MAG: Do family serine endopeptidase [Nitrospirales bacterium]|nr:Do family serine endopeptidase [Nitrospirales bacterium]